MADNGGLIDAERGQDRPDIASLGALIVAFLRMRRETHAAQVGNDDAVITDEVRCQRSPHIAGITKAMDEHDYWSFATGPHMQRYAIGVDVLRPKGGWKRQKFCGYRAGQHQRSDNT
jgi:hypothetical protein